jgi:hypothetical protein
MKDMNADRSVIFLLLVGRVIKRQIIHYIGFYIGCLDNDFGVRPQTHRVRAIIISTTLANSPSALGHFLSLSLSTPSSLIHASQKSLKRAETFAACPTPTDHHV